MRAAFKTSFSGIKYALEFNENNNEEPQVNDKAYQSLKNHKDASIEGTLQLFSKERISCFAHTLQLTIKDGLKETKYLEGGIRKVSRLAAFLHCSTIFKKS